MCFSLIYWVFNAFFTLILLLLLGSQDMGSGSGSQKVGPDMGVEWGYDRDRPRERPQVVTLMAGKIGGE